VIKRGNDFMTKKTFREDVAFFCGFFLILIAFFMILSLPKLPESESEYVPPEEPHLYWKDIDVVVTDITKRRSLNGRHYSVTITVKSEEYGLEETFTYHKQKQYWNYDKGETVKAQLYSWVMDSTGEIVKRQLNKVY
jgi:cellulose synthase/poly-beta-1,6-N-acetylglucosamine synthase-like glycosyltransferase